MPPSKANAKRPRADSGVAGARPRRGRGMESPSSGVPSPARGRARGSVLLPSVPEADTPRVAASVPVAPGAEVPQSGDVLDSGADVELRLEPAPVEAGVPDGAGSTSEEEEAPLSVETWAESLQEARDEQDRVWLERQLPVALMRQLVDFASKGKEKAPRTKALLITLLRRLLPYPVPSKEPAAEASGVVDVEQEPATDSVAQEVEPVPETAQPTESGQEGDPPSDPEGEEEAAEEEAAERGGALDGEDEASLAVVLSQLRDADAPSRPDLEAQLSDTQLCLLLVMVDRTIDTSKFTRKKAISALNKLLQVCSLQPPLFC